MAALPKRQNDISSIFVPLLQCEPNVQCTHLCAKFGALYPSNNRKRSGEFLDAAGASSNYAQKGFFDNEDVSFLNLMFSRLSRIIVYHHC